VLKRAALVSTFDEELFRAVLNADLPEDAPVADFDRFITRSAIVPVPRSDGIYCLKDSDRKGYLDAWWQDEATVQAAIPPSMLEFSHRLVAYYEKQGREAQMDLLASLITVDQKRARKLFLKLYAEADEGFDLPRCNSLLRTFEDRNQLLTTKLREEIQRHRQYYNARCLFTTDYYRTTTYHSRQRLLDQFEKLLAHPKKWIFHLYAKGGMGKTMFLRWLLARHCVPEPRRIPVARLDFDLIHLTNVNSYPWLLLHPLVEQLNEQLAGRPFGEMLGELQKYALALRRSSGQEQDAERSAAESMLPSDDEEWKEEGWTRFRHEIKRHRCKPIVIILDTIEEMVLTQENNLLEIIGRFASIHEACPGLRFILAGRYDLRERIPEFKQAFARQILFARLNPFTGAEALSFLREKRQLSPERHALRAIYKRSEGNPFKLALFADLASAKGSLTEEDVAKLPEVGFAYLIERIVKRIRELEVRWVLRYAVIPRQFTRDFLEKVVVPHLRREMENAQHDRPNDFLPEGVEDSDIEYVWLSQSAADLKPDQVWDRLRQYASGYGWVEFKTETDSLHFQPEVVIPMRQLLRNQKIFPLLHEDAISYFEQKAKDDPRRWAEWTGEAVYHYFQRYGAEAAQYWRTQAQSPQAQSDPAARRLLAKSIVGQDYVDDEGRPRMRNEDERLIEPQTLVEAHCLAAEAAIVLAHKQSAREQAKEAAAILSREQARQEQSHRAAQWTDANYHLKKLRALLTAYPNCRLSAEIPPLTEAAKPMCAQQFEEAVPVLEKAITHELGDQIRLSLELQLGDLLALFKRPEAETHYLAARKTWQRTQAQFITGAEIALRLADWYSDNDRFFGAESEYKKVLDEAAARPDEGRALQAALGLALLHIGAAQYTEAKGCLSSAQSRISLSTNAYAPALRYLEAQIELDIFNPEAVLRFAEATMEYSQGDLARAMLLEMRGAALGELMQYDQALRCLEEAKDLWKKNGENESADRCRWRLAQLHLYGIGNLKEAAACINAWQRLTKHPQSEISFRMELLWVVLLAKQGQRHDAAGQWRSLLQDWGFKSPRRKTRILATSLALQLAGPETTAEILETLEQIEPFTARLLALEPMRLLPTPPNMEPKIKECLLSLVAGTESGAAFEWFPNAARLADVYRLLDDRQKGGDVLGMAEARAKHTSAFFAAREVQRARARWEDESVYATGEFDPAEFERRFSSWPALCGAVWLEQAELAFRRNRMAECQSCLEKAGAELDSVQMPTQWRARLHELRGKAARAKGEILKAESRLLTAYSSYERLADELARRRVEQDLDSLREERVAKGPPEAVGAGGSFELPGAPQPASTNRQSSVTLTLDVEEGKRSRVWVTFNLAESEPTRRETERLEDWFVMQQRRSGQRQRQRREAKLPEDSFLLQLLATKGRAFSSDFAEQLSEETDRIAAEMGNLLFSTGELADQIRRRAADGPVDFKLQLPPCPLAVVPWELTRLPGGKGEMLTDLCRSFARTTPQTAADRETVKWIQIAANHLLKRNIWVDGVDGPQTRIALRDLQRRFQLEDHGQLNEATRDKILEALHTDAAIDPLRVMLVQPREESEIQEMRGAGRSGLNLRELYEEHLIETAALFEPDVELLEQRLVEYKPHVIHLAGTLREFSRAWEAFLEFGGEGYYARKKPYSSSITTSHINRMLKRLPDNQPRGRIS
jgi:putative peptidoglycan binding protein